MKRFVLPFLLPVMMLLFAGCTGIPEGLVAVEKFELNRYLGTWYEIARIDNRFERGTGQVSATYSLRDDGMVRVLNKGYNSEEERWKTAEGRARFAGSPTVGALEVSFFGPFYGSYNIIDLDRENYSWAMVTASSRSWLWILSKKPQMEPALLGSLYAKAGAMGFDTLKVMRVPQSPPTLP